MQVIYIDQPNSGQRLTRYLERYLPFAPKGFLYKMLRKKNIVLNGHKALGNEILSRGDEITLWLSDETIQGFMGDGGARKNGLAGTAETGKDNSVTVSHDLHEEYPVTNSHDLYETYPTTDLQILYEDAHVILINKPAGMLSQRAAGEEPSLCEYLIGYLLRSGAITPENLKTMKPSVCNRLDRNTSGIVCCGKSIAGLQALSALLRDRSVHKYYQALVMGRIDQEMKLEGLIQKDGAANVSRTILEKSSDGATISHDAKYACTFIRPLRHMKTQGREMTLVEAELITGRSHQIRSALSAAGHAIVGDVKYASKEEKTFFLQQLHVRSQLLHCARMVFPKLEEPLAGLSERTVVAPLPKKVDIGRAGV